MGNLNHGKFSRDGREYIVTNPFTPRAWHNYLFNREYLVNLTQSGTGASFYQPRGEGLRVNVTEDRDGNGGPRFVYLRDNETGAYWSLTGAPGNKKLPGWRTGSAAWLYITAVEWLLGARAEYDGLRIDPRLPGGWKKIRLTRPFRGDTWHITIQNRSGRPGARVQTLSVDGRRIEGTLIKPFGDGQAHTVRAVLA
jgi:cellobiose phosphorylase